MRLNLLQKMFSIINEPGYKTFYILGVPFKFSSNLFFNMKYGRLPIDNNKIVFCNFKGSLYGCNPKYIAEEILRRQLPYNMVWLVDTKKFEFELESEQFPKEIKIVNYKSHEALKELATAKIWVDNQRKIYHIKKGLTKKEGQYYIQTWHGSLGIKKIGLESPLSDVENSWIPYGIEDANMIDFIISNSEFEDRVFDKNFWGHGKILNYGHPRNDIFYRDNSIIRSKVLNSLGLSNSVKVLLYVPSFRDDYSFHCYGLDYNILLQSLSKKFGGDWVVLVRMHPNLLKYEKQLIPENKNIIDVSKYPDIQELLVSADVAISDYSSCIFDFMLSRKPAFIFATDIDKFNNDRGFYYPLTQTPFPVASDNVGLLENIKNFNNEVYLQDIKAFLDDKKCIEDGHASERVVDLIKEIINKEDVCAKN